MLEAEGAGMKVVSVKVNVSVGPLACKLTSVLLNLKLEPENSIR